MLKCRGSSLRRGVSRASLFSKILLANTSSFRGITPNRADVFDITFQTGSDASIKSVTHSCCNIRMKMCLKFACYLPRNDSR